MMSMDATGKEYAAALYALALEGRSEQEYYDALRMAQAVFADNPTYPLLLDSPDIPAKTRCALLEKAFENKIPEHVLSFLQLLSTQRKIALLDACIAEYAAFYRQSRAVLEAVVKSVVPLTMRQQSQLVQVLEKRSGHCVHARFETQTDLLGGVTVELDDMILDGSLRRRLNDMKGVIES